MKIVINTCFGGFGLSPRALAMLPRDEMAYRYDGDGRNDSELVRVVETLGAAANGKYADLKVVGIPDDIEWYIHDYDGVETIHEQHRSWC